MKLSTKGRYAITAMLDLAVHDKAGPLPLADLSESQGISQSYLEQLFARLRSSGLVKGIRGPGGGYRLARAASEISVADIVAAVDDEDDGVSGHGQETPAEYPNATHAMWEHLSQQLFEFLDGIKLSHFVEEPERKPVMRRRDSHYGWGFLPKEDGNYADRRM